MYPPPPPTNSCLFSESTIDTVRCCVCILYSGFIHNIPCCSWLDGWGRRQGRDPEGNGQPGFSISPPDPNQFFFVPAIIYCHLFIVHPKRYVKAFKKLSITLAVATSPCIAYGIEKCYGVERLNCGGSRLSLQTFDNTCSSHLYIVCAQVSLA